MAALALLLLIGSFQDESALLERLLRDLEDDAPACREAAQRELVSRGPGIRPFLQQAMAGSGQERRARIAAVLAEIRAVEEREFALKQITDPRPFPLPPWKEFHLATGTGVKAALDRIREAFGVNVECFDPDGPLAVLAAAASLPYSIDVETPGQIRMTIENGGRSVGLVAFAKNAVEWIVFQIAADVLDALPLVDARRVVLVRPSPALVLEALSRERLAPEFVTIEGEIDYFDTPPGEYWSSMQRFLQVRAKKEGSAREWSGRLADAARARDRSEAVRVGAILGLRRMHDPSRAVDPRIIGMLKEIAEDGAVPARVRAEAYAALVDVSDHGAPEVVMRGIGTGPREVRRRLFRELTWKCPRQYGAAGTLRRDPAMARDLEAQVRKGMEAEDSAEALPALVLASRLGMAGGLERLLKADPADDASAIVLEGLQWAGLAGEPIEGRLRELQAHRSPRTRAGVAVIYGSIPCAAPRKAALEGILGLLADAEPRVRWAAVRGLANLYHADLPRLLLEHEARLRTQLEKEPSEAVRTAIKSVLGS